MFYNSEFSVKSQFNNRTQMIDLVDDVLYLKNRLSPVKESLVNLKFNHFNNFLLIFINLNLKKIRKLKNVVGCIRPRW